jgi:hypothetical protein
MNDVNLLEPQAKQNPTLYYIYWRIALKFCAHVSSLDLEVVDAFWNDGIAVRFMTVMDVKMVLAYS